MTKTTTREVEDRNYEVYVLRNDDSTIWEQFSGDKKYLLSICKKGQSVHLAYVFLEKKVSA